MVEVFKTNVIKCGDANRIVDLIHVRFPGYKANFDLDDCDRILRVKSSIGPVTAESVIHLLKEQGIFGEVLPDEVPGLFTRV